MVGSGKYGHPTVMEDCSISQDVIGIGLGPSEILMPAPSSKLLQLSTMGVSLVYSMINNLCSLGL